MAQGQFPNKTTTDSSKEPRQSGKQEIDYSEALVKNPRVVGILEEILVVLQEIKEQIK